MSLSVNQIISAICSGLAADSTLDSYIEMAMEQTSTTFFGANRNRAIALRAAHMWTLDRNSNRTNGEAGAIQSKTEGKLSLSFAVSSNNDDDLSQTHYGRQLKSLLKSKPSMRVIC